MGALCCTRFLAGLGVTGDGCTAATAGIAGVVTVCGLMGVGCSMLAGLDDPFEQPLVMSRKTPDMTVTASRPAPSRAFSFESGFLSRGFFWAGRCGVLSSR